MESCTAVQGVTDFIDTQDKRNACAGSKLHFKHRTKRGSNRIEIAMNSKINIKTLIKKYICIEKNHKLT